ncbi:MAG: N-acyl-D-amino-acid deacylase family protein [Gemmatimonadaceae bacterium]
MRKWSRGLRLATGLAAAAACGAGAGDADRPSTARPYDVVISNGRVIDGAGNAWFLGDVGIRGDRIVRIAPAGLLQDAVATTRINASGLAVAPGFIDIQSHSRDPFLTGDGRVVSKISQGITTEIMGEGWTNAPANDKTLAALSAIDPSNAADSVARRFVGPDGFDRWLTAMEQHGVSPNIGSFIGATTIRVYAKGAAAGAPSSAELDTMRAVVRRAMEDGAFGVASALIYPPGNFAGTEELVEIARAMAPYGGVYISHMRSEADQYLEAIDELLRIGREGGVATEIYHLKAGGVRNWPKAAQAVAKIDSARAAGQDVQANMYPYVAGGTGLAACTPPWASADDKLLPNLRDAATRARVIAEMSQERTTWENLCRLATPAGVMTVGYTKDELKQYEGKRIGEIAVDMKKDWANTVIDLILATDGQVGMLVFMMSEPNVEMQLKQPWIKIGTDADGWDPDSAKGLTHPRAYGTYPRILGHYVRERRLMPLEDAIRKMSSAVATRLSIRDRGLLKEGFFADIVVFDPATIGDKATFTQPHQISTGMKHVFVNGTHVWNEGTHTGAKPGRVLRGQGWKGATP